MREHQGPVLVVDGSNLACLNRAVREGESPSYAQLNQGLDALRGAYPGAQVYVVVDANLKHKLNESERQQLERDIRASRVIQPPAGNVGAGDTIVLALADRKKAIVVSNDNYQEFHADNPWLRAGRVVGATLVGEDWLFTWRTPPAQRTDKTRLGSPSPGEGVRRRPAPRPRSTPSGPLPAGWETSHWWGGE